MNTRLSDVKKREMGNKYDPTNFFLERYDYDNGFENEKSTNTTKGCEVEYADTTRGGEEESTDLPQIPPQEGDEEEVKEEKGIKILTPNKLFPIISILFAQIKAENSLYKLKNQIRQILYLLYQHNKISKKL